MERQNAGAVASKERDVYDPVPHSHVVPAGYLRAWADGKQIVMRLVGDTESRVIGVRDAGVRKNFYRRERPATGESIYDIEWSLGTAESAALPVVAAIRDRWPLNLEDKAKLGQFFALQHLRGDAFRAWHGQQVDAVLQEARSEPEKTLRPHRDRTADEVVDELATALTSDTYRVTKMLKLVRVVGVVFTSMHWCLVDFADGGLATSDHPVVVWPLSPKSRRVPAANDLGLGALNTLEVFVALSPSTVLLMTWRDEKSVAAVLPGREAHAATVNAFVVANAQSQWFHEPGAAPAIGKGARPPLSRDLLAYDAREAQASIRRAKARELSSAEVERPLNNDPLEAVGEDKLPTGRQQADFAARAMDETR